MREPTPDTCMVYLFGPGFGESILIGTPDSHWIAIDSCITEDGPQPLTFLKNIGCPELNVLIITHPDLDHIEGASELIKTFNPKTIKTFPAAASLSSCCSHWLRKTPNDKRYLTLKELLDELEAQSEACSVNFGQYGMTPLQLGEITLQFISPTFSDINESTSKLLKIINPLTPGRLTKELLDTHGSILDAGGNSISLVVVIKWFDNIILLGGDAEAGSGNVGWEGIVKYLKSDRQEGLITDVTICKVSHHGSKHSLSESAWSLHSKHKPVEVALLTPYQRGQNQPPHEMTLRFLESKASCIALSVETEAANLARTATSWTTMTGTQDYLQGANCAVSLHRSGRTELFHCEPQGCWII